MERLLKYGDAPKLSLKFFLFLIKSTNQIEKRTVISPFGADIFVFKFQSHVTQHHVFKRHLLKNVTNNFCYNPI